MEYPKTTRKGERKNETNNERDRERYRGEGVKRASQGEEHREHN